MSETNDLVTKQHFWQTVTGSLQGERDRIELKKAMPSSFKTGSMP